MTDRATTVGPDSEDSSPPPHATKKALADAVPSQSLLPQLSGGFSMRSALLDKICMYARRRPVNH